MIMVVMRDVAGSSVRAGNLPRPAARPDGVTDATPRVAAFPGGTATSPAVRQEVVV